MDAKPDLEDGVAAVGVTGAAPTERRSIVQTWTEVFADAGGLVRAEAALARAETAGNLNAIARESAKVVVGGMLALMALVFLTVSAVVALAYFTGLLLALLIVALVCLGAGWLLVKQGLDGVSGLPVLPERSLRRMGNDLDMLADRAPLPEGPETRDGSGGAREAA